MQFKINKHYFILVLQSTLLQDLMLSLSGINQVGGNFLQASLDSILKQQDYKILLDHDRDLPARVENALRLTRDVNKACEKLIEVFGSEINFEGVHVSPLDPKDRPANVAKVYLDSQEKVLTSLATMESLRKMPNFRRSVKL